MKGRMVFSVLTGAVWSFQTALVDGLLEKLTIVELEIKYTLLRDRQTNRRMANFARYTQRKSDRQTE